VREAIAHVIYDPIFKKIPFPHIYTVASSMLTPSTDNASLYFKWYPTVDMESFRQIN